MIKVTCERVTGANMLIVLMDGEPVCKHYVNAQQAARIRAALKADEDKGAEAEPACPWVNRPRAWHATLACPECGAGIALRADHDGAIFVDGWCVPGEEEP